jgi:ribosomal protein S18 acetylase RimI-like enzyme
MLKIDNASIEFIKFTTKWHDDLRVFFEDIKANGDPNFFAPHQTDSEALKRITSISGRDLYYLLLVDQKIMGYGLLRGWDEGYKIPSLGIAIHPSARGAGLGCLLMNFLHALAAQRSAQKIRLRVSSNNAKAIHLYQKLGYVFEEKVEPPNYLVGFKILR